MNNSNYQIKFTYLDGRQIQYKLIHQPVREPFIYLNKNEIFVVTSKKLNDYTIKTFVPQNISKYSFIAHKKEEHASINTELNTFRIFEKYYQIKQANLKSRKLYDIIGNIVYLNQKYQKQEIVKQVYNDIVCPYVLKRLKYWQIKMGLAKYKIEVKFNWSRRELGSCYAPHNNEVRINFTNRLFAYNKKQMDCIIVHELSHIVHFHHKKSFWEHVTKYLPDYYELDKEIIWT